MNILLPIMITAMTIFAPLSLPAAEKISIPQIKSIFFQRDGGREVVQIRLSEKVTPKIFELDGEKPRVVFDFVNTRYEPDKIKVIKAGGIMVKQIRVGLHTKPVAKTRVVVDMAEGVEYDFAEKYGSADAVFRIIFTPPVQAKQKNVLKPKEQTEKVIAKETLSHEDKPAALVSELETISSQEKKAQTINDSSVEIEEVENPAFLQTTEGDAPNKSERAIKEKKANSNTEALAEKPKLETEKQQILKDVTFEKSINGNEMILFHLNGFYPPVVYSAESGELFVVCDFLGARLKAGVDPVVSKDARYIKQIKLKTQQQPRKVRVELELAEKNNYDLKQVFFKEENLFVLILSSLAEKKKNN